MILTPSCNKAPASQQLRLINLFFLRLMVISFIFLLVRASTKAAGIKAFLAKNAVIFLGFALLWPNVWCLLLDAQKILMPKL